MNNRLQEIMDSPYAVPHIITDAFTEESEHPMHLRPDAVSFRKPLGMNPSEIQNANMLLRRPDRIVSKKQNVIGQGVN